MKKKGKQEDREEEKEEERTQENPKKPYEKSEGQSFLSRETEEARKEKMP